MVGARVRADDFVRHVTHDARSARLVTLVDEFTQEALTITVARKLNCGDVTETLAAWC